MSNWPDSEGRTLEEAEADWDTWPDDGSRCEIGAKPPRPTLEGESPAPEGMTIDEFFGRTPDTSPPAPEPGE